MAVYDHRPARIDVLMRAGDAFRIQLNFTDTDGSALDISGWTFAAKAAPEGGSSFALTPSFVTDGTNGQLLVAGTVAEMAAISRFGHWDVQRTDSGLEHTSAAGYVQIDTDPAS